MDLAVIIAIVWFCGYVYTTWYLTQLKRRCDEIKYELSENAKMVLSFNFIHITGFLWFIFWPTYFSVRT